MQNNRIEYLDSLRGIAAMSVVIFHCMISFNLFHEANYDSIYTNGFMKFITESPLKILWSGQEAVLLFFVLSGFVLSISYLNGKANNYSIFLVRRVARIYIPYLIVMSLSILLSMSFMSYSSIEGMSDTFNNRWDHPVTMKALIAYAFMINYDTANVNGVVWTLFHEMRISIIFPFIMWIVIKWNALKSLLINAGIIAGTWLLLVFISLNTTGTISFLSKDFNDSVFYATFFVLGATLSKYRVQISNYLSDVKLFTKLLLFILSVLLISSRWVGEIMPILSSETHQIIVGLGIILLFAVVLSSGLAQRILMSKPLLWIGKVSFSLYLIHILILMLLAVLIGKNAIWLTPFISLPMAGLTYKLVEEPAIKIGKKWTSLLKNRSNDKKNRKKVAV